jgi:hypothetical protein
MTWLARPFWEVRLGLKNVLGLCMGKMVEQNYPPCGEDEKAARFTGNTSFADTTGYSGPVFEISYNRWTQLDDCIITYPLHQLLLNILTYFTIYYKVLMVKNQ